MENAVNWFEIYTSDFERAKRFYSTVFQPQLTEQPAANERHPEMRYATFQQEKNGKGACGALVYLEVVKPGPGGTVVYFNSADMDAELARVEANGGKILRPKHDLGDFGYIALIEDSEGNLVGLHAVKSH